MLPTLAGGISFGVLAQPVMGSVAPVVMSIAVFSGAAQFAALTVLTAGGGAVAAIAAAMLMNGRWLPMGLAVGPFLSGGRRQRAAQSLALVDASFALSQPRRRHLRPRRDDRRDAAPGRGLDGRDADRRADGSALADPRRARAGRDVPRVLRRAAGRRGARQAAADGGGAGRGDRARADAVRAPGVPVLAASAAALLGLRVHAQRTAGEPAGGRGAATRRGEETGARELATGKSS